MKNKSTFFQSGLYYPQQCDCLPVILIHRLKYNWRKCGEFLAIKCNPPSMSLTQSVKSRNCKFKHLPGVSGGRYPPTTSPGPPGGIIPPWETVAICGLVVSLYGSKEMVEIDEHPVIIIIKMFSLAHFFFSSLIWLANKHTQGFIVQVGYISHKWNLMVNCMQHWNQGKVCCII